MPILAWPEIRNRAAFFAHEWQGVTSEREEAQSFWNEFFEVFGVHRRRTGVRFEKAAQRFGKKAKGRIDVFWPGTLLAEHKSTGEDLDAAHTQATNYFEGLTDDELPRYVVVSDFQSFRLYDLDDDGYIEFKLKDLPNRIAAFGFIAGYSKIKVRDEDPLNIKAVQKLGELHDALKRDGFGLDEHGKAGHVLQVFLVRVLFCLFADDTGLFSPKDSFLELVGGSREDGADTGGLLAELFEQLNMPREKRQRSLEEQFAPFPFVNGRLFEERLPPPRFGADMRRLLLECCAIQWSNISPAIFGAMFQKIIDLDAKDRRRQLGAHYTSEANILKLIGPLFLNELRAEFERAKNHKNQLFEFHKKLARLSFLDPACGCGNFLVITYRELRKLELDAIRAAAHFGQAVSSVFGALQVNVDQFHGIEIEEFPSQVAQVAMWLTDHQMNVEAGREFGEFFARLPLEKSANIRLGNALRLDWEAFVPPTRLHYILGNPPFVGKQYQTPTQKEDLETVGKGLKGAGVLDYVSGWYFKAAQYLSGTKEGFVSRDKKQFADVRFTAPTQLSAAAQGRPRPEASAIEDIFVSLERQDEEARKRIRCAFVSTNSITQGEQVGVLWSEMFRRGLKIQFAHRTFKWSNEAPGKAAVHCVIVGFGRQDLPRKRLFDYAEIDGPAQERAASNINPYLAYAPDVVLPNRRETLYPVPEMSFGSMANDNGHLLLNDESRATLLAAEPDAERWIRRYLGSEEFINGITRWCLWLKDISPAELQALPQVRQRVEAVRKVRSGSKREATNKLAMTPGLFGEVRQPSTTYLGIPKTSSERRAFIPMGFLPPTTIANTELFTIADAKAFHFGILSSTMHMAWVRYVCGRLKSDFRYSAQIVYNNFPWPLKLEDKHRRAIEQAAQGVLDAREVHPGSTLAQLYDPDSMPPKLAEAHAKLDRAVDAAYVPDGGARTYSSDADRVAFLFRRYAELTSLIA
ncbi:MAG: DNA methyltransferase [Gammaproteobacteria bacterium]